MEATLEDLVRNIVAAVFDWPVDKVTMRTSEANTEEWDSMSIINLMIALESEFGIILDVDEVTDLRSVESMVAILRNKGVT